MSAPRLTGLLLTIFGFIGVVVSAGFIYKDEGLFLIVLACAFVTAVGVVVIACSSYGWPTDSNSLTANARYPNPERIDLEPETSALVITHAGKGYTMLFDRGAWRLFALWPEGVKDDTAVIVANNDGTKLVPQPKTEDAKDEDTKT
ncbi:MAG: hypothetical protein Q7R85_02950 [bacterium]|nr:hypothetical protein [bacterium]